MHGRCEAFARGVGRFITQRQFVGVGEEVGDGRCPILLVGEIRDAAPVVFLQPGSRAPGQAQSLRDDLAGCLRLCFVAGDDAGGAMLGQLGGELSRLETAVGG